MGASKLSHAASIFGDGGPAKGLCDRLLYSVYEFWKAKLSNAAEATIRTVLFQNRIEMLTIPWVWFAQHVNSTDAAKGVKCYESCMDDEVQPRRRAARRLCCTFDSIVFFDGQKRHSLHVTASLGYTDNQVVRVTEPSTKM